MRLEPYLCFYGKCDEALEFYKATLGGAYEVNRFGESPAGAGTDESWKDKVIHATFKGDGFTFMASDGQPNSVPSPKGETEISLSLGLSDIAEAERIFKALADGGWIVMPFGDVTWGGKFGMVNDKYGVSWMITAGHG
jgi:PhnB protein